MGSKDWEGTISWMIGEWWKYKLCFQKRKSQTKKRDNEIDVSQAQTCNLIAIPSVF